MTDSNETKPQCPMCGDMGGPEYWAYCKAATCAMRDEPAPQRAAQEGDLPPLPHWCEAGSPMAQQMQSYARLALAAAGGGVPQGWRDAVMKAADELDMEWQMVEGIFHSLLPSFMADKNEAGFVTVPLDALIEDDSYGVHGSDFYRCKVCGAESGAGMLNKGIEHNFNCPLASSPQPEAAPAVAQVPSVWIGKMDFETLKARGRVTATLYGEPVGDKSNEVGLYAAAPEAPAQADPTDPGYDVEVLREHVRHLERRVRQLSQAAPSAGEVGRIHKDAYIDAALSHKEQR